MHITVLLVFLILLLILAERVNINYSYDDAVKIDITFSVFTLSLWNFGKRKKRKRRNFRSNLANIKMGTKALDFALKHSYVTLNALYSNNADKDYSKNATQRYGIFLAVFSAALAYAEKKSKSFVVEDGAVLVLSDADLPKRQYIDITQSIRFIHLLCALLITAYEKIKNVFKKERINARK